MRKSSFLWLIALLSFIAIGSVYADSGPIKIGVMFVMSGPMGGYGKHGSQAVKMAVEEINQAGGILGRRVEAVFADTELKKDKAIEIAKKFIQDKVDFVIGPTSSGVAVELSKFMTENKKILILTQAASDSLTGELFSPYVFATLSNAMMHSRAGAYYMATRPYKKWMCIGPDYNYGRGSWAQFKEKLKELRPDVEFVGELWPKLLEKDYGSFIDQILEAKPEAVWSPLWGMDAVNFIRQGKQKGLFEKIKFAFPDGAALETLVPLGKDMPEGIYVAARYFFLTPNTDENRHFVDSYKKTYGEWPDYMAEETYAGVYFIKAAVERAKSLDPEQIIKAVEREPLAWSTPEGWKIMRPEDHSVVEDVVWGETSFSERYGFAILKNMEAIQGEQIVRSQSELKELLAKRAGKR